jgi:ferritin-like metal-binding protein YciE
MSANEPNKVFENELKDLYSAEQQIESALEKMANEVENDQLREAFSEHREQTQGQIERLERVFEKVGLDPEAQECKAISGLVAEHEEFTGENPSQPELDVFDSVSAQKVEHYEIATYGSLAHLADRLGMDEAGDLLHETLEEEENTLNKLVNLANDYDYQQLQSEA